MTSFREQAERWAQRKFLRSNPGTGVSPIVNEYELLGAFDGFSILRFSEVGEEWFDTDAAIRACLRFVRSCRLDVRG